MVVTRFAPSPTGSLHIGGIKMALYDYALAKKNHGKFILRIEDTDRNRFVEGSEQEIIDMLKVYGLEYDEFYKQSERLEIYQKYAFELIDKGAAYFCFTTAEEIEAKRKEAQEKNERFLFRSPYRDLPIEEAKKKIANGEKYVIRQKLPENEVIVFADPIQGTMSFNTNDLDETVLLKSDGFPTYHLAAIVDDHLMGVTHVFRGVEWQPSVPKHVMLYKAFGWEMPVISHLSVILDPDGGKLSKRRGSVSAKGFIDEGYLPEAVLNFLMLLGWSDPTPHEHGAKERELFSLNDFIELFDIKDANKAAPIFNREKLLWFNQKYIQAMPLDELSNRFLNWLKDKEQFSDLAKKITEKGPDFLQKILSLEQNRVKLLSELPGNIAFFYNGEATGKMDLTSVKQTKDLTKEQISGFFKEFILELDKYNEELSDMTHEMWENIVRTYAEKNELKGGSLFMTLRLAVTDSQFSPPLFEVMQILGKAETKRRLESYI